MKFPEPATTERTKVFNKAFDRIDPKHKDQIESAITKLEKPNTNNCDIIKVKSNKIKETVYRYKFGRWRIFLKVFGDIFFLLTIDLRDDNTYKN